MGLVLKVEVEVEVVLLVKLLYIEISGNSTNQNIDFVISLTMWL